MRRTNATLGIRQWGFRSWYLVGEVYVCVPPKCGSTSLMKAVDPNESDGIGFRRTMHEKKRGPFAPQDMIRRVDRRRRLLAVRDPVDRFRSLWRHLVRSPEIRQWWEKRHRIPRAIETPAQLLEHIRACPMGNYHWYPQAAYLVPGADPLRYDRILDELGLPNVRHNVGRAVPHDNAIPAAAVRALYPLDVELWERANH